MTPLRTVKGWKTLSKSEAWLFFGVTDEWAE